MLFRSGPIVSGALPSILRGSLAQGLAVVQTAVAISIAWSVGLFAAAWVFAPELRTVIGVERFPLSALALVFSGFLLDGGFGLLKFALITKGDRGSNAWMLIIAAVVAIVVSSAGARFAGLVGAAYGCLLAFGVLTIMRWRRTTLLLGGPALSAPNARALMVGSLPMISCAAWASSTHDIYARAGGFLAAGAIGVSVFWALRGSAIRSLLSLYSDTMPPKA